MNTDCHDKRKKNNYLWLSAKICVLLNLKIRKIVGKLYKFFMPPFLEGLILKLLLLFKLYGSIKNCSSLDENFVGFLYIFLNGE